MPLNFKDFEVESTVANPFQGDCLNRGDQIELLTEMVKALAESGCVMALDGEWGTGKSTFVKMWRNYIKNKYNTDTLYFNAWESDYIEDPMIALMGELKSISPASDKVEAFVRDGSRIVVKFLGGLAKGAIKKASGFDCDSFSEAIEETSDILCERINGYESEKDAFDSFKQSLSAFVADASVTYPLVFFIDELDRCTPHYAVKVLERIKHLFDVPNIVFVLAVNENQMQHAIEGFYGSSDIDGKEYLKRFIDLEYKLPEPDLRHYAEVLCQRNEFESLLKADRDSHYGSSNNKAEFLEKAAKDLISCHGMNLRSANKFMAYTRLAAMGYKSNSNFSSDLLTFLCYLRMFFPNIYTKIRRADYTIQELLNEIESELPRSLFSDTDFGFTAHHMSYIIAELLLRYNTNEQGAEREQDFKGNDTPDGNRQVFPIVPTHLSKEKLDDALTYFMRGHRDFYFTTGLFSMFERIELMSRITF